MKKNWLYNKNVLISGASGGIGFNIAKILIEKYNCTVFALARNEEKLNNAKNSLKEKSKNYIYKTFDVSKRENWQNLANEYAEKNIKIDILINNAGFMLPFSKFENYSESEIEEIIDTNLMSVIYSVKYLLPILKTSTTPAIINISSSAGNCAVVGESMYCATKFAVKGFTDTIRQDYKKKIYVCGVYPGFIRTNILNRMSVADKENKLIQKLMLPVDKASKRIVNRIKKKKKSIILGIDGKTMSLFARLFPNATPSIVRKVLKTSKLDIFDKTFN